MPPNARFQKKACIYSINIFTDKSMQVYAKTIVVSTIDDLFQTRL
jgi:hypothetical protein